jgi:hypothetical protein
MTDRSDAIVVTISDTYDGGTRYVFEPRDGGGYEMVEKTLTKGGDWRTVGSKLVDSVEIETP